MEIISDPSIKMTATKWISETNARSIYIQRNGGIYGCTEVAFKFNIWINPHIKTFLRKEYKKFRKGYMDRQNEMRKLNRGIDPTAYFYEQFQAK
jgi:thiamine kinase-like enzyme